MKKNLYIRNWKLEIGSFAPHILWCLLKTSDFLLLYLMNMSLQKFLMRQILRRSPMLASHNILQAFGVIGPMGTKVGLVRRMTDSVTLFGANSFSIGISSSEHSGQEDGSLKFKDILEMPLCCMFYVLCFIFPFHIFAQKVPAKEKNQILSEGIALYTIILANWTSNDLYYENEFNTNIVKGYLSYKENDTVKTIFWKELDTVSAEYKAIRFKQVGDTGTFAKQAGKYEDLRRVIKTITYPKMNITRTNAIIIDAEEREPTKYEKMLMDFRQMTYDAINKDTAFFKEYEGTILRAIPMDLGKEVKVYVCSSGNSDEFVPLGGDYLLTYTKKGKRGDIRMTRQKLHNNIIFISSRYRGKSYDAVKATYHYHKGDAPELITATDIATLLLYKNIIEWDEHHVISDKYTCIFTLVDRKLEIISTGEYEYIKKKKEMLEKEAAKANWH